MKQKTSLSRVLIYLSAGIFTLAILSFLIDFLMPGIEKRVDVNTLSPEQYLVYCAYVGAGEKTNTNKDRYLDVEYDQSKDKYYLWIIGNENLTTSMTKSTYLMNATDIYKAIFTVRPDKVGSKDVDILVCGELVDKYGNNSIEPIIQITLNKEISDKINWDNFDYNNLLTVGKRYWIHDIFE